MSTAPELGTMSPEELVAELDLLHAERERTGQVSPESGPLLSRLAVAIQGLESREPRRAARLIERLLRYLRPLIRSAVWNARRTTRSVSREDATQVASMEVVKCLRSYQPSRGGSFAYWVNAHLGAALRDYMLSHAADVSLSHGAARKRWGEAVTVLVTSADAPSRNSEGDDCNRRLSSHLVSVKDVLHASDASNPEEALAKAQDSAALAAAVNRLQGLEREVIAWTYGIGRPERKLSDFVVEWNMSYSTLKLLKQRALESLRKELAKLKEE